MGVIFVTQAFLAAALGFSVQPFVARLLLPSFGGSAAVWTTTLVFFQVVLVAGYAWAHISIRWLGVARQAPLHLGLAALGLLALPGAMPAWLAAGAGDAAALPAVLRLIAALAVLVGLPFFVLGASSPAISRWFAATRSPGAREPYRLYAASNAGSLLGLAAYPLLIEPGLDLADQARGWGLGFGVFVVLMAATVVVVRRDVRPGAPSTDVTERPSVARWLRWAALAGVPAALLVGVTAHLSTDVGAVPLLWTLPLATYLVTLIVAFARPRPIGLRFLELALPVAVILAVAELLGILPARIEVAFVIHLGVLLVVGLVLHGRLAADRPDPTRLTSFTLALAAGGAAGGLAAGIVGPLLLPVPVEEHVALGLVALLAMRPGLDHRLRRGFVALVAVALVAAVAMGPRSVTPGAAEGLGVRTILVTRSFYGAYRVVETSPGVHALYSGTTIHGAQDLAPARRLEPQSYYARSGPLGDLLGAVLAGSSTTRIGAVGLGTGALAAYGRPGDTIAFFEIDSLVVELARDPDLFTYLSDSRAAIEVVVDDGRLGLAASPAGAFDVVVLDAFSSDAVPVHLLTVEAIELAMSRTAPGGVVAYHVSNRWLDLEPVVVAAATALGYVTVTARHVPADDERGLVDASEWVVIGRATADLAGLSDAGWTAGRADGRRPWTDRQSDLVGALRPFEGTVTGSPAEAR